MAIPATAVWECRSGGDDTNGGGFDSAAAGTDRSLQTAAHVTIDGATITCTVHTTTTQLNIVGYVVSSADIGNIININGGTMTLGRYYISGVDVPNNRWLVDRTAGTAAQTGTGKMGGCVKFPGALTNTTGTTMVSGNIVWIKNDGAYALSTATPGNGGPASIGNIGTRFEGYQTTRGDLGTPPTISAGAQTGVTVFGSASTNNIWTAVNIKIDGNNGASNVGFGGGARSLLYFCDATQCSTAGFTANTPRTLFCSATLCGIGFDDCVSTGCFAEACTTGYRLTAASSSVADSIADSCTGDGFNATGGSFVDNCSAYGNGGDGFDISGTTTCTVTNNISVGNTGYGYNTPATVAGQNGIRMFKNAAYSNTAGNQSNAVNINYNFITLTGNPFVNAAANNFSLNNTAGAGAACRAVALGTYGQTSYGDLGPVQHQDAGGGGGGAGSAGRNRFQSPRFMTARR